MKRTYIAKYKDVKEAHPISGPTPENVWSQLVSAKGFSRAELRASGWRVKLKVSVEKEDVDAAAEVVEMIAPKPVGKVVGFLRKFFG